MERRVHNERTVFERYSIASRQVIFVARAEAGRVGSSFIDTEHLLLGILRVAPAPPEMLPSLFPFPGSANMQAGGIRPPRRFLHQSSASNRNTPRRVKSRDPLDWREYHRENGKDSHFGRRGSAGFRIPAGPCPCRRRSGHRERLATSGRDAYACPAVPLHRGVPCELPVRM